VTIRILLLVFAIAIAVAVLVLSVRRKASPGAASLIVFSLALALWAVTDALSGVGNPQISRILIALAFLAAAVTATSLFTFTLEYTDRSFWLGGRTIALLAIEPLLTQILFWTGWRGLFVVRAGSAGGSWDTVNVIYTDAMVLSAIVLLIDTIAHSPLPYRRQATSVLIGGLFPIAGGIVHLARLAFLPPLDVNLVAYAAAGLALLAGLVLFRMLDVVPIARNIVVERMKDGWMVLDKQDRIVDLNPAVEELLGLPRDRIFGQPAENILSDWPNLTKRSGDSRELDIKGSINTPNGWRYLNIRLSPLADRQGHPIGQVIVWRDITERRRVEEARQRARDEMFVLLHAISGAASRALNLDDFLAESIYQIVYSFQSESSVIFLLEEAQDETESQKLYLAAHHGLPMWGSNSMASIPEAYEMVASVLKRREPLLIPDISTDPRIPWSMQQAGRASLLIVPMSLEEQLLGVIGLSRKKGPVFSTDEIARLTAVAEEVATFISSNRQRQLAIAMTERQRLVRDLHDSVTQKLYGLVTLTEAAQAGLEAGSPEMSVKVLSRVGENARQALKEMRLFLHELSPVDLEREGLVAVLHQRLAAVEGRADVKARLLADDNVSLPLDKEVALYYIAQEALNNTLRHANAKSVTVRIKNRKTSLLMEVEDDGCGFNTQQEDKGGMGLRNMRERTDQVGGKLKVVSTPGKGTRITVTVSRNSPMKSNPIRRKPSKEHKP
jgi:PAS domain S-box-containing protein